MIKPRYIVLLWLALLPLFSIRAEKTLSVLTWNTARMDYKHKPGENQVLRFLESQDADIVCLQEADVYKSEQFLTLPEVKKVMSRKYPYSFLDFSTYNNRHQFGTMVWSKYPLINKTSIHYEDKTANLSNRCDIVVGTDTFRLFNNHLQSYSFVSSDLDKFEKIEQKWKQAVPLRNKQAQVVRKEIDDSPYPVIVVGDFNSIPLSFTYLHISRGLHDAWRATHLWDYGATCIKRGLGVRIDYILSADPLLPRSSTIHDTKASDHRPVSATLVW